jgi:hypothetical protein
LPRFLLEYSSPAVLTLAASRGSIGKMARVGPRATPADPPAAF